jgi:S-adenosylmethionine-diacylglycerol 3-amino-3-carboxypropyl transferase
MKAPLQFSVMREDPRLEELLLDSIGPGEKRFFGITAAGCTLLQLAARPDLISLVGADLDPHQTAWARFRINAARLLNRRDFCRLTGVSQIDPATREALLNKVAQVLPAEERAFFKSERAFFVEGAFDDGTFERLFSCWRTFVERFVARREAIQRFFEGELQARAALLESELWPVSFELFFHHRLLSSLFGSDAVQHAPPGSYPLHFRTRFEWALEQPGAPKNPYLSHVLRGRYGALDQALALPDFLLPERYERLAEGVSRIALFTGRVTEALLKHPGPYQVIQLSNILDWLNESESQILAGPVLESLAPGGFLLLRQLNNVRPLPQAWVRTLDFDPALERDLQTRDRSFLYSAIRVGRKR